MVKLTNSLSHWLWVNHRDIIGLVMLGHVELITPPATEVRHAVFKLNPHALVGDQTAILGQVL